MGSRQEHFRPRNSLNPFGINLSAGSVGGSQRASKLVQEDGNSAILQEDGSLIILEQQ